jgi:hypothetical protein
MLAEEVASKQTSCARIDAGMSEPIKGEQMGSKDPHQCNRKLLILFFSIPKSFWLFYIPDILTHSVHPLNVLVNCLIVGAMLHGAKLRIV